MKTISKIIAAAALMAFAVPQASAQYLKVSPDKYAVKFTDKNNNGYSLDHPEEFLTQKALDRRAKFKIGFDEFDLPINMAYVDSLKALGFPVQGSSKWLNCAVIQVEDTLDLAKLDNLDFIVHDYKWLEVKQGEKTPLPKVERPKLKTKKNPEQLKRAYNYGEGLAQAEMLGIDKLHAEGYCGQGMTIAVFDAGFYKANQLNCFTKMYTEGRVLGVRDFADNDTTVYDSDNHGMNVLSCIAGNWSGHLVGTAPEASAYLFRTEISSSENIIEEFLWAFAAEVADSLGVDMIHSSLGYHKFDDPSVNYLREHGDGNTTIGDIAADRAAAKGIVVTISGGNGGDDLDYPWVTSPADADSVLAVGAVDKRRKLAYFSSIGNTVDGRVKPDVCAMGFMAAVQGPSNRITHSNGTSFSGPILAGCVLCLMQAHPEAPVMEILQAVRAAGDIYDHPNPQYGYGIPDFEIAHKILKKRGF
ncbi:MAG: S8 family serine peptidase [Bacteroidales bacterium]|nr:S8 family serine peptidase [Bacteroidales bacterium]